MRLDFNVLWVDDQPARVESHIESLKLHVMEEGFNLEVTPARTIEEAQAHIGDSVFVDDIDLVLVDYDLGQGVTGDAVITEIRRRAPYKDVVFYSAIAPGELRRTAEARALEGVYFANRTDLSETLRGVFDALVKKVLDIDHCRGIVLGATSDIDAVVHELLTTALPTLEPADQALAVKKVVERLIEKAERLDRHRATLEGEAALEALFSDHELFTSYDKLRVLSFIVRRRFTSETELRKAIAAYMDTMPRDRNRLGHVPLVAAGGRRELRDGAGETITAERLRAVRRELIAFREHLDRLADLLTPSEP